MTFPSQHPTPSVTSNVLIAERQSKGHRVNSQLQREQIPRRLAVLLCAMQKTGLLYPLTANSASPSILCVNPTKTDNVLDFNKHAPLNTIRSLTALGAKQVGEPFWVENVIWHEVPVASWSRNKMSEEGWLVYSIPIINNHTGKCF